MRFSIQYQASSDEWAIFDTGGGSDLVSICRTEEEALLQVLKLQEKTRVSGFHPNDDSQQIAQHSDLQNAEVAFHIKKDKQLLFPSSYVVFVKFIFTSNFMPSLNKDRHNYFFELCFLTLNLQIE